MSFSSSFFCPSVTVSLSHSHLNTELSQFKNRLSTLTASFYHVECDWLSLTERHSWTWRCAQAFRRQREQASTPGKLERTVKDVAWCVPHTKAQIQPAFNCTGPSSPDSQLSVKVLQTVWRHTSDFDTLLWVAIKLFCTVKAISYFIQIINIDRLYV